MRIRTVGGVAVFTLAVAMFCSVYAARKVDGIEFTVSFTQPSFKKNEPIQMDFILKNIGKNPVMINSRFEVGREDDDARIREIYLKVARPDGTAPGEQPLTHNGLLPRTTHFLELKPGQEQKSERASDLRVYYDIREPGEYEVTAVYSNANGNEIGLDVFRGPVESGPVTIEVTE